MNNIPIYRATKIDSDEIVIGDYCNGFIIVSVLVDTDLRIFKIQEGYQIDPITLQISFDRAKWFDIERINKIMENQVNCTTCNDTGINHHNQPKPNKYKSVPCECKQKEKEYKNERRNEIYRTKQHSKVQQLQSTKPHKERSSR